MMRISMLSMIAIFVVGSAMAQNMPDPKNEVSLFSDVKANRIGDTITVMISESNSARKSTNTQTNKETKANAEGDPSTGVLGGIFPGVGGSVDLSNEYSGQGQTTRNGSFTSRMTLRVVDVLPNRNLVVEGSKTMEINEDTEVITLSGIVRQEDISRSNTVYSYQVADAKITYKGKGSVSDAQRPGLITRIINWIL